PCLRRTGPWIGAGMRMARVAGMPAERLGQAHVLEERRGVEEALDQRGGLAGEAVALHAQRRGRVLDRPDRAEVIAEGIKGGACAADSVRMPQPENMSGAIKRRTTSAACAPSTMPVARQWAALEAIEVTWRLWASSANAT